MTTKQTESQLFKIVGYFVVVMAALAALVSFLIGIHIEKTFRYQMDSLATSLDIPSSDILVDYHRGWFKSHAFVTLVNGFDQQPIESELVFTHGLWLGKHIGWVSITADTRVDGIELHSEHQILFDRSMDQISISPFSHPWIDEYSTIQFSHPTTLESHSRQYHMKLSASTENILIEPYLSVKKPSLQVFETYDDQPTMELSGQIEAIDFEGDHHFRQINIEWLKENEYDHLSAQGTYTSPSFTVPLELSLKSQFAQNSQGAEQISLFQITDQSQQQTSQFFLRSNTINPWLSSLLDGYLELQIDIHDRHESLILSLLPESIGNRLQDYWIETQDGYQLKIAYQNQTLKINDTITPISEWFEVLPDDGLPLQPSSENQILNWS